MTKFKFWNEVCKYGAIIGLVMSVAFVIEQSLMLSGWFSTMGLVWILAAVVYPTLFIVDSFQVIKTDMGTI